METKNGSNKKPYLRKASQAPCVQLLEEEEQDEKEAGAIRVRFY